MVRALVVAGALAGVIVACSFQGQQVGLGGGRDAAIDDATPSRHDGAVGDAPADAHPLDAKLDAQTTVACTPSVCGPAGGTCQGGTCVIVGAGNPIMCPANIPCEVDCIAGGACQNGVSCGAASSCYLRCEAMNACGGSGYSCGAAGCTIDCTVNHACENQVVMSAGACSRHCCASHACGPATDCLDSAGGCQ